MTPEQISELVSRITIVAVLAFAGLASISFPACFASVCPYFSRVKLSGEDEERMDAALDARKDAENIPTWLGRVLGIVTLVLASVALIPQVVPIFAYAGWCVAFAAATAVACLRFRQATQRRVALLMPRDVRTTLPVPLVFALLASIAVEVALAAASPNHLAWAMVAASSLTMLAIAGQVATSPALILGNDVPVEYYIDERLRLARTTNVAGLAIAPLIVLLGTTHDFSMLGVAAWIVAFAAGAVTSVYVVRATNEVDSDSARSAMGTR